MSRDPIDSSETWLIHVAAKEARIATDLCFIEAIDEHASGANTLDRGLLRDEVRRLRVIYNASKRYKLGLIQKHKKLVEEAGGWAKGHIFKCFDDLEKSVR